MPKDREIERKYVIPSEKTLEQIMNDARDLNFPGLAAAWFLGPFNINDTYYDTEDLMLLRSGRCFRAGGRAGREAKITFKEKTEKPEERIEIADTLKMKDLSAALNGAFPSRAVRALRKRIGRRAIFPKLRVYKMFHSVMIYACEVVFGHTVYAGPAGAIERLDLEIEEFLKAYPGISKIVGDSLALRYDLTPDMRSKYEVGMELVGEKKK